MVKRLLKALRPLDFLLGAVIAAFIGLELADHFTHYRTGRTLSDWIWAFEHKFGIPARVAVGLSLVVLTTHLLFHLP